jgi:hypothetical protein
VLQAMMASTDIGKGALPLQDLPVLLICAAAEQIALK